jgi:tape measure domain-containing protein
MKGVEIKVSSNSAQAKRDLAQLNKSVGSIDKTVSNLNKAFVALGVGIAGAFAVSKLNSTIAKASDSLTLMGNSIAQVTGRTKELARVQSQLYDISRRTATSVETNTKVFKSFGIPLLETGRSIDEVVKAIDSLAVAGALGGESAESLNAALIQLGQGISSGALRGEELNSVLEQAPRIAKAISDELGVTRGSLRAIAKEGGLTAEVVVDALLNQSEKLNREFASMEFTSTEAMSNVKVTATRIIGEIDKELNFTSSKTNKLMGFANYLEANRESIVSKTVSQLSNLSVSMSGLTTTFSGLGAVIGVIVGRIGDSLPAAITPFLAISDDIVTVFSGTWFRIQAYWRKGIVDFNAMIAKTFGVGMQGAIRAIFTSNSLQEFGDSLHALSEALDSYGRRWYNIGNRTEKYFKSFTFRSRMFLIYLGLMEQKALFLQYVSFERLSKGLEVASYFAKKFVENIKATDSLAVLKTGLVQIVLLLKRVAEAFDNLAGNRLSKGIRYIGNSFKQVYSLSETWLKKATNVVKSFSETVERAFFWV